MLLGTPAPDLQIVERVQRVDHDRLKSVLR
jgi:hypothetical protein